MARSRVELQSLLESVLGSRNVYFQPPASVKMKYPAIVYERYDIDKYPADNIAYLQFLRYTITVIDKNPDSEHVINVSKLSYCSFDRHYTVDNLHHDVFTIYF